MLQGCNPLAAVAPLLRTLTTDYAVVCACVHNYKLPSTHRQ
jgi:hypothetical protein